MDLDARSRDIPRMTFAPRRAVRARSLLICLLGASLGACDRSASRTADDVLTDSARLATLDSSTNTRAALAIDTASGTRCEARAAVPDPGWEVARARSERAALDASHGGASRDGGTLRLTLSNNRQLAFVDCNAQSESWLQHEYHGLDAVGRGHLIAVSYYEGGVTQWVHAASGSVLSLASAPVFAPDGQHFAVANADLEAGYTDNVFAIYRVTDTGAEEVFREAGGDEYGAATPVWTNADTVTFTRVHRASTPGQLLHLAVTAMRDGDSWRVDPDPPPSP